jgi:integrase
MKKHYRLPLFYYSNTEYQCYIFFGAFDHTKGKLFYGKIRNLKKYSEYSFEALRKECKNSKKGMELYIREKVFPAIEADLKKGKFDKGENENWTKTLAIRNNTNFIPIVNLLDEYYQQVRLWNCTQSNKYTYKNAYDGFKEGLKYVFGSAYNQVKISDIKQKDMQEIFDYWKRSKNWGSSTRRTYRSRVHVFFDKFLDENLPNPVCNKNKIAQESKARNIAIPKENFIKIISFLKASGKRKCKELLGMVFLIYYGLLRGSTILQLQSAHIRKGEKGTSYITVYKEMIKNGNAGTVMVPTFVIDYLEEIGAYVPAQPTKYLFPRVFNDGQKLRNRMWASNLWTDILKNELKFEPEFCKRHNLYSIKPTGAIYLLEERKWSIAKISKQMLHLHIGTTLKYITQLDLNSMELDNREF